MVSDGHELAAVGTDKSFCSISHPCRHKKIIIQPWHRTSLACILALSQEETSKIT